MGKKKVILAAGIAIALVIAGLGYHVVSSHLPVPSEVRESVSYSPLSPKFSFGTSVKDQATYNPKTKLVVSSYIVKDVVITLSQQAKPQDVDLNQIDAQEKFLTSAGTVYVLKAEPGLRQSILETSDAWTYISAKETLPYQTYKQFILGIGPAN